MTLILETSHDYSLAPISLNLNDLYFVGSPVIVYSQAGVVVTNVPAASVVAVDIAGRVMTGGSTAISLFGGVLTIETGGVVTASGHFGRGGDFDDRGLCQHLQQRHDQCRAGWGFDQRL